MVSIVAVFLALALGVLVGTTVVNQGVIEQLRSQANNAVERSDRLRRDVNDLRTEIRQGESFGVSAEPWLLEGKLAGEEVVLITVEGVDLSDVDAVRRSVAASGGEVVGVLQITAQMSLVKDGDRTKLAEVLGLSDAETAPRLLQEAAARLAGRLANGHGIGEEPDMLDELISNGFVDGPGQSTVGIEGIGGSDQAVVLLSGGNREPAVPPSDFLMPLVASLVRVAHPVAAGEPEESRFPFVPLLRQEPDLDGTIVTVDNADSVPGRIALVLGVRDLLSTGRGGDYGVKAGASGLLPTP